MAIFEGKAWRLTGLQDSCTANWHKHPIEVPSALAGLERLIAEQHLSNFQLWHAEDSARAPGVSDQELAGIKRFIDRTNQTRNDLAEQCDCVLLERLRELGLPAAGAELHSESPGLIIDRLSILSLKLFHMREEAERTDATATHRLSSLERLRILEVQREDLASAMDRLWQQILDGSRGFRVYRQMKMYNDPALNPAIYGAGSEPS